jgi:monoamine oxidase
MSRALSVNIGARQRVGGRVEQAVLPDGRLVQLGGEVVGRAHTAYLELVAELGLTMVPSYVVEPGEITFAAADGVSARVPHCYTDADAELEEKITARFVALARDVDPADPWAHPDAAALDRMSVTEWLLDNGASRR